MKSGWQVFNWSWWRKGKEFRAGYNFAYSALTNKKAGITVDEILDFAEDRWSTADFKEGLRTGAALFVSGRVS